MTVLPLPTRLPLPLLLAYLVALATLIWLGSAPLTMAIFGVAVLATLLFRQRIEQPVVEWGVRAASYLIAITCTMSTTSSVNNWIFNSTWILFAGTLAAAEVTVQYWKHTPHRGALVCLCGLIIFAACNTDAIGPAIYCAITFFACLSLYLSGGTDSVVPRSRFTWALRLGALALAILLGASCIYLFTVCGGTSLYSINITFNPLNSHNALVGMSTTKVTLARVDNLQFSPTRVLRLSNYSGDGHLRGLSYPVYHRGNWTRPADFLVMKHTWPSHLRPNAAGSVMRFDVLEPSDKTLYLPLDTAGVRIDADVSWNPQAQEPLQAVWEDHPYYSAIRATAPSANLWPALTAQQRDMLLQVPPEIDVRVRKLAWVIAGHAATDQQKIAAVISYLRHHYRYSTSIDPGGGDPVSNFLLRYLNAHCVYFASGATILLRCLGVPTRYVAGYYAHEQESLDTIIVRQGNAHAWAESWVDGQGWVTVDATPASALPGGKIYWARRAWAWLSDLGSAVKDGVSLVFIRLWPLLLGVAVACYLILLARSLRQKRAPVWISSTSGEVDPALIALAVRFTRWLAKNGTPCAPVRPWQEHLQTFAAPAPAQSFVQHYNAVRFGAKVDECTLAAMSRLMAELEKPPAA